MNLLARCLAALAILLSAAGATAQTPDGRVYAPGPFDRIEVDGVAQVRLVQGDRDQVVVAGDDDVQRGVEVELAGDRLVVHTTGAWKFWTKSKVQVEVQVRRLAQLTLSGASDLHAPGRIRSDRLSIAISGAGTVRFDDLSAGTLKFDISGAGDAQLAGQASDFALNVSGKGKLQAEQLRAARADVSISGVGNAQVWVTGTLNVSIAGVGNVEYWGRPEVQRSTSGLGSVKSLGDKR
jgi:hypothetical protein